MFIRSLSFSEYGIFKQARFDLTTDIDHPIVLVTGNNGAGKTSFLEGMRLALHGRRAFDNPIGEAEYLKTVATKFHAGGESKRAAISLEFDFLDFHTTRRVELERSWTRKRQHVAEDLKVVVDGRSLMIEDAEDFLNSIIPPQVARYFFFDGERIRELADWDAEDESALFGAVGELLGLGVIAQLRTDLTRLSAVETNSKRAIANAEFELAAAEERERQAMIALKTEKSESRKIRGSYERARSEVRRVGALQNDEVEILEREISNLASERRSLLDEAQRAAADILPLLCARTLRKNFGEEIESRKDLEDRSIVIDFLENHATEIKALLITNGLKPPIAKTTVDAIASMARGTLVPVSDVVLPSLSRTDSMWMRRVIEKELPEMQRRNAAIVERLRFLDERLALLEERRRAVPINDPASESALQSLEQRQRALIEHEARLVELDNTLSKAKVELESAQAASKAERFERFRTGRLKVREASIARVLDALPVLSERMKASKEKRFGSYLEDGLKKLWHKKDRLKSVDVSFSEKRIELRDAFGEINKSDLSAGEKQLFAVAFIYALSKLSGKHLPFVIDTPLGRLDQQHRRRFVTDFVPNASHQVILLSTDTEITGSLYRDIRPLLAHHHELATFNGGMTEAVEVVSA